jgi:hypothetical protein
MSTFSFKWDTPVWAVADEADVLTTEKKAN